MCQHVVSVWTIDLARIMSHYHVRHLLCTITLGVDATYSQKVSTHAYSEFYQHISELHHLM